MELKEKVIKGIECCLPMTTRYGYAECKHCPYDRKITVEGGICECCHDLMSDALELARTQESRVTTWDELIATDHVYIETNKDGHKNIVPGIVVIVRDTAVIISVRIGTRLIDGTIDKDDYGIECRCWTSRPTDEQMNNTPWEERDNGEEAE